MPAYYNDNNAYCCTWLHNLMKAGLIPDGTVDERSIKDVEPRDLEGFTQCHFFAGIGGWAYALNLASWGERSVWTGSCPCQPFSDAGKHLGVKDDRHLWPWFGNLIAECRPATVFGEQVASKNGLGWLANVRADMEAAGYEVGAADLCAASAGAPHIRQRLYWVAESAVARRGEQPQRYDRANGRPAAEPGRLRDTRGLADAASGRAATAQQQRRLSRIERIGEAVELGDAAPGGLGIDGRAPGNAGHADKPSEADGMVQSDGERRDRREGTANGSVADRANAGRIEGHDGPIGASEDDDFMGDASSARLPPRERAELPGLQQHDEGRAVEQSSRSFWSDTDWIDCRDGKRRPVEPGTFPLAHGIPGRVGRLRSYGNAIVPQIAAEFIRAYLDCQP